MSNLAKSAGLKKTPTVHAPMAAYKIGDKDKRPWGHYIVTGAGITNDGKEFCEKLITIKPFQVLSLHSHNLRQETWTVKEGKLIALCDGLRLDIPAGETIRIPMGSIHCMANMSNEDCIVEERQEGICREGDIRRYMDVYCRSTEKLFSPIASESFIAYRAIVMGINKTKMSRAQSVSH